jgi:exodeoxyribonuclease-3
VAAKFGKLGTVKIATWNVNSLRARADRVEAWLQRTDCDVLAIQETKCKDDNFPWELFENMGYEVAHFGVNQWNGVAIASRVGLDDVERTFIDQPVFGKSGVDAVQEARAIGATCGGIRVWSLYVPNGRSLEDEHMPYKLSWLDMLKTHAEGWVKSDPESQIALMGDWNIAPQDDDVWDIDYFRREGLTHVSEPERAAFHAFEDAGFQDVVRPHTPGPGVYTYWDYTQLRFPKKEGMRIDFVLASPALAARVTGAAIDREERKGKGASDHAPVIVELTD